MGICSLEVVYNVKYKFKNNNKSLEEFKYLFNVKLINIILKLENKVND